MRHLKRLHLSAALAWSLAALLPHTAFAQQYPTKPIRIVVPYAAGGLPDTVARIVANHLPEAIGQTVFVENKPGSQGAIAVSSVMQAGADGYSLLMTDGPTLSTAPLMNKKVAYDANRDLVPVSVVGTAPLYMAVSPKLNVNTLDEFIALAKSKPGGLDYGSSGIGSIHHLTAEAMKAELNLSMTHIPYKGSANSVPALVAGDIGMVFSSPPSLTGFVKTGQLKLLAINSAKRAKQTPNVPALSEKIPGFDFAFNVVLLAPTGTPKDAIQRMSAAIAKVVKRPDVIEQLQVAGVDVVGSSPTEAAAAVRAEAERIVKAAHAANLKAE
jgi:tripartite-type tricarboxylate transporter receptor subunit TctC